MAFLERHSWEDTLGKTLLGDTLGVTLLGRHSWETLLGDTPDMTLPFSSLVQKCHTFQGVCAFSPLDAALTMRFAENSHLHTSKVLRLPHKMKMDFSKVLCLPRKFATHLLRTFQKYCACHTKRRSTRFADTGQCHEVPRLPRKPSFPHPLQRSKKTSSAALPMGTGTPPHNHSSKTNHVESSKRAFRTRLPPLFTLCTRKIDVFLRFFSRRAKFATSESMFRARFPSIFMTCHKMPSLPRNLHLVQENFRQKKQRRQDQGSLQSLIRPTWSACLCETQ